MYIFDIMDILDIIDIMDIMNIMDIRDIMDILDIIDIMDIMIITSWMVMAGAVLALVLVGVGFQAQHEAKTSCHMTNILGTPQSFTVLNPL